jgi:hypothetical protein
MSGPHVSSPNRNIHMVGPAYIFSLLLHSLSWENSSCDTRNYTNSLCDTQKFCCALYDTNSNFCASNDTAVSFTGNTVTFDEEKTKIPLCRITQGIIPSSGIMHATNMLMID